VCTLAPVVGGMWCAKEHRSCRSRAHADAISLAAGLRQLMRMMLRPVLIVGPVTDSADSDSADSASTVT